MPLLKGRFVTPTKSIANLTPGRTIYTIPYTNEQFLSKEEYEARLSLYADHVWTCQATGQIRLTHREAWESEQTVIKMLKQEFPECWAKPVLDIVHHSTDVLDVLTDKAWRKLHEELHLGEPVILNVSIPNKITEGVIVRVDKSGADANIQSSNCSSPSSNKENSDHDNVVEKETSVHVIKPQASDSPKKSPRKFSFPKLLPYKYAVRLKGEDKIIADIPASGLKRVHHLPVKELVKTYIRTYAWRGGSHQNSPWVVKEELVQKYHLTNKIADIFLSPSKMYEMGRQLLEDKKRASQENKTGSKRKHSESGEKKSSKRLKMTDSNKKVKSTGGSPQKPTTLPKKSPNKFVKRESFTDSESDSLEDIVPLAVIKSSPSSQVRELMESLSRLPSPRRRGRPTKAEAETVKAEKELLAKMKSLKKKFKEKDKTEKSSKKSPKGSGRNKKTMKQVTLFDLKDKKKAGSSTPKKSPVKGPKKSPFKIPPIAQRLLKVQEQGNKPLYHQLVGRCAKVLPQSQIKQLPEKIREPILKRCRTYEERKKLEKMTPEEREEYLKKKKEEYRKKLSEMMKNKRLEQSRRFEDTDLELKPIPTPRLVETPDGLANELFGSVAMVTEFIICYKDLFTPKDDSTVMSITTDALMNSLVSDSSDYGPLAHVLTTLLQTLLQDGISEDYRELGLKMSEIPVNQYTASELVRLCLWRPDKSELDSDMESEVSELICDDDMLEGSIGRLEMCEFYELEAETKLDILLALCHRLMGSYSVEGYMEEKQRESADLWKRRIAEQKQRNAKRKGEKAKKKEMRRKGRPKSGGSKSENKESSSGVSLETFYSKISDDAQDEADLDLASVVKRRRIMAELRRKQQEEEKMKKEQEAEECRKQKEMELFEKEFKDGIMAAKDAFRKAPLGTDRNHNRYWLFHRCTPGLFVEKGWASTHISYSARSRDAYSDTESSDSNDDESVPSTVLKRGRKTMDYNAEKTVPRTGQNLWFIYDQMDDVNKLIENLHPLGVRESMLKVKLQEMLKIIANSIQILNKQQPAKPEPVDIVKGFREELLDMETRLMAGGLGGVANSKVWEKKLAKAKSIEEFGQCLVECQAGIFERFLKGVMVEKAKPSKVKVKKEDEDDVKEDGSENGEPDLVAVGVERWKEATLSCSTFSRLHVLMGVLDASIKWEKSAENAKCKICRKKGDEDRLLLCDQCNQAYHLYCLRPALCEIPRGEWFCPACAPPVKRVTRTLDETKDYRVLAGYSESESDEPEPEANEQECAVCGGDEDIYPCSTCPSSFHLDCHEPPLRREPRSTWRCMQCTSGIRISKSKRAPVYKKPKYAYDDDDDDEDFEEKPKKSKHEKQRRNDEGYFEHTTRSYRHTRKHVTRYAESDSDDDDDSEVPTRKSSRRTRARHSYTDSDSEGDENYKTRSTRYSDSRRSTRSLDCSSHESTSSPLTRQRSRHSLVNGRLPGHEGFDTLREIMMEILKKLRCHRSAWPFMEPVDAEEVPDYYTVIKKPMDLQTVENKCISEQYKDPQLFVDDIALMINNSYVYNKPNSTVGKCTKPLENHFLKLIQRHLPDCVYPKMLRDEKPQMNGTMSSESDCHDIPVAIEMFDHDYFSSRSSKR